MLIAKNNFFFWFITSYYLLLKLFFGTFNLCDVLATITITTKLIDNNAFLWLVIYFYYLHSRLFFVITTNLSLTLLNIFSISLNRQSILSFCKSLMSVSKKMMTKIIQLKYTNFLVFHFTKMKNKLGFMKICQLVL